jgi:hypothetical protein
MSRILDLALRLGWDAGSLPDPRVAPNPLHRALALLACISLFIGTRTAWTGALNASPTVLAVLSVCYLGILLTAVASLIVRSSRALAIVDVVILAIGCALVVGALIADHRPNDEGVLVAQAARSMLAGHGVYGVAWPEVFAQQHIPITWMMGGGADYTFGYPPLDVLLTAPVLAFVGFPAVASVVTTGMLLIGSLALWRLLPIEWRSGATAVMLGFPFMPHYARLGYPAIIAMVWLIPVVLRWPSIGAGGRLRRSDLLRAVCVGAACATQQLAWFAAPFLIVGLYALRRGEVSPRRALMTVATFAGIAAATFLVINLPFIVSAGPAWASGVLLVLTQHAIPHGQGLIDVSFYLTDGSARLDFYSYATLLLALGLLGLSAIWVRRLGPALTVIPWLVFYLSIRSQDGYFLLMTPLWFAAVATAPPSAFQHAWQPRLQLPTQLRGLRPWGARRLGGATGRVALAGLLLAPALLCATVAIASDEPLELGIVSTSAHAAHEVGIWQITVDVINTGAVALTPRFTISTGPSITPFWTAAGGPDQLAPRQRATYLLTATDPAGYTPGPDRYLYLRAVTDRPMTVSTVRIPIK